MDNRIDSLNDDLLRDLAARFKETYRTRDEVLNYLNKNGIRIGLHEKGTTVVNPETLIKEKIDDLIIGVVKTNSKEMFVSIEYKISIRIISDEIIHVYIARFAVGP